MRLTYFIASYACSSEQYAVRSGHLRLHLKTNHNALKEKPKEFLSAKLKCLESIKLDTTGASDKGRPNC
jgi:hypothetical protein